MKKTIALLLLTAVTASAQVQMLDSTTPHTNSTTTSAKLNVPSKGWTNVPYSTTNYIYITLGDGVPASAAAKLNSNFVYLTNQLALALQLPNQINTNWQSAVATQSNRINVVIVNIATISNQLTTTMATVAAFPGENINNGSVNSNKFDSATLGWLQSVPVPGYNLLDMYNSSGSVSNVPVANGDGTWAWGAAGGGGGGGSTMFYDGGSITSDGNGNIVAGTINAGLMDSGYSTGIGTSGYLPIANGSGGWYWTAWPTTLNYDGGAITSDGSGQIAGTTWWGGLRDSGYSTGTTGYSPVADGYGGWTWMAMVTITNVITNTVTVYNLSNAWLGSQRQISYKTNNAAWGASNYLARVAGIYNWSLYTGDDGGNPPMSIPMSLVGSYNGSNGWFVLTNGFRTTNYISIAAITNGLSARGLPRASLGAATLWTVDKWELLGRENYGFGQGYQFDTPKEDNDPATKGYVDTEVALALNGQMTTYGDTNYNSFHTDLNVTGTRAFGITSRREMAWRWMTNDASGLYIHCPTTNLAAGYTVLVSTNLALGKLGFVATTNFSAVTNGAEVIITIPMSPSDPQRFVDILTYSFMSMQFDIPTAFSVGTTYPSNTWNLATITNGMGNFSFWTGSSNGQALVTLWRSNAAGYYLTWSNGVSVKTPAW